MKQNTIRLKTSQLFKIPATTTIPIPQSPFPPTHQTIPPPLSPPFFFLSQTTNRREEPNTTGRIPSRRASSYHLTSSVNEIKVSPAFTTPLREGIIPTKKGRAYAPAVTTPRVPKPSFFHYLFFFFVLLHPFISGDALWPPCLHIERRVLGSGTRKLFSLSPLLSISCSCYFVTAARLNCSCLLVEEKSDSKK